MPDVYKQSFKQNYTNNIELSIFNCGLERCAPGQTWGPGIRDHYLIHLVVARKKSFVWIRVENTYDGAFRADGTLPKTTKTDARYHGYGLKSIYDTAEKYGGTAEISTQEKRFTLKVLLPVQQK